MAANRGKNTNAHKTHAHKKGMSRGTKIRKRIFGVTSLIMALVLANIPMGARAELVDGDALSDSTNNTFRLIMPSGWDTANYTDGMLKLDSDSKQSDSSTPRVTWAVLGSSDAELTTKLTTLDSSNYTGVRIYDLTYSSNASDKSAKMTSTAWGDSTLKLGISNLDGLLNAKNIIGVGTYSNIETGNFRDTYWADTSGKYGTLSKRLNLYQNHGAKLKVYVHRQYFTVNSSNEDVDETGTGSSEWIDAETLGVKFTKDIPNGNWLDVKQIPAGYGTDGTRKYRIDKIAIAFREQMYVESRLTDPRVTGKANYLMAASYPTHGSTLTGPIDTKMLFQDVKSASTLKPKLTATGRYTDGTDKYFEFNMTMVNALNNSRLTSPHTYAVSIPLPDEMNVTGNSNDDTNYHVYRNSSDADSSDTATVVPVTPFEVIDIGGGKMALQFSVQFADTTSVDDFAVVCHNASSTPDPSTTRNVTVNVLPGAGYGTVRVHRSDQSAGSDVFTGTAGTITVSVPTTVDVTLTPNPATGETFEEWQMPAGTTLATTNTHTIPAGTADVTVYAKFSQNGSGVITPTLHSLTVKTDPSGLSVSPATSNREYGTSIDFTANDNPGYYFGEWIWDPGNTGGGISIADKQMTQILYDNSTATAKFYTLKYLENRNSLLVNPGDVSKDLAKLVSGTLSDNTVISANPIPATETSRIANLNTLAMAKYPAVPVKVKALDYFELKMNPSGGVRKPYSIRMEQFPLPYGMNADAASGGRVDLWFHNALDDSLMAVNIESRTDTTITFTIDDSVVDMVGDYVFVQTTDPAFTVQDNRSNPVPSTNATGLSATYEGELQGNRRLEISDYPTTDTFYKNVESYDLDGAGTTPGFYDDWALIRSELWGRNPNETTDNIKTDPQRITFTIPVDTSINSDDVKVYQVTKDGGNNVTGMTQLTPGTDYNATAIGRKVTEITFNRANSSRYNGDFLFLFSKTPEFDVYDYRTDKPADSSYIPGSHVTAQSPYVDDRYVTIENITPESAATITQRVRAMTGYDQYQVIPYDIRYLDNPNPAIGVDMKDYGTVGIRLTIPTKARNKYNLQLVSLNENVNPAQLILPESATFAADESYVDFTAKHFSEYALIYLEDASIANQVQVTAGTITPSDGGGFGGTGTYQKGDTVTLTAYPAAGRDIQYWTTDDGMRINVSGTDTNGNKTGTFVVTKDTVVNAFFDSQYKVVGYVDPAGGGTVTPAAPDGQTYTTGETAVLQATPSTGQEVDFWEDNGVQAQVGGTIYQIPNISANHTVVVHFKPAGSSGSATTATTGSTSGNAPVVNVTPTTTGGGSTGGTVSQATQGSSVTLTAVPSAGFHFKEWRDGSGNVVSTSNPYTFTPVGTVSLQAVFEPDNANSATNGSGNVTVTQTTTGKGSNSIDMPRTGLMDHYTVYKMLGVVILTMFGVIEILSSLNTRRRRVVTDG